MGKSCRNDHEILKFFLFFFIFINLPSNQAEIQTIQISSDSRSLIPLDEFGFTEKGRFSIQLSDITVNTPGARSKTRPMFNSSLIGLFVGPFPAIKSMKDSLIQKTCIIGKPSVFPILSFKEIYLPYETSREKTYHITIPGLYYIFFVNCAPRTSVSMFVNLETYNLNSKGRKDYLHHYFSKLPTYNFVFAMIYFAFFIFWLGVCFKNKLHLHKIHLLMSVLLLFKFWSILCLAENQHFVRVTGSPQGWDIFWFVFHFIHALIFVGVVVLIGFGWSLLRQNLLEHQKYMLGGVILIQFFVNIAFIKMHTSGPFYDQYRFWVVTFHMLDFLAGIAIIFPVTDSVETLKEKNKLEGKEARNLAKLRHFRNFHKMLQAYVYTTRMGMFILRVVVKYNHWWVTFAIEYIIDLLFYIVLYYNFRPSEKIDYISLSDREEEDEEYPIASMMEAGL